MSVFSDCWDHLTAHVLSVSRLNFVIYRFLNSPPPASSRLCKTWKHSWGTDADQPGGSYPSIDTKPPLKKNPLVI